MDILQIIKEDHKEILKLFSLLETTSNINNAKKIFFKLINKIIFHLYMEREYLYPEALDFIKNIELFIEKSKKNNIILNNLANNLKTVMKSLDNNTSLKDDIEYFKNQLIIYFENEEDILMPKLREYISTQEREDIGQVFLDVKEEHAAQNSEILQKFDLPSYEL